jgi:hypothetical protein
VSDPLGPFCFEATQCPDVSLNLRGARSLVITDLVPDFDVLQKQTPAECAPAGARNRNQEATV